jgi:aryl-alcohol dehydrogenase-like predicted oxidoreductase
LGTDAELSSFALLGQPGIEHVRSTKKGDTYLILRRKPGQMEMIPGAATIEDTFVHARKFNTLQYNSLGQTQWQVSQAGFGCYRVSAGIDAHFKALRRSLSKGINLIDTSTNYTDGGSERLVGAALAEMMSKNDITRQAVVVVSKVGYLQGQNFALSQARRQQGNPFPDVVPYGKGLEHCIHPEFLEDQLSRSLERLGLATLDVLLLHNPEYYLGWAAKQGHALDEARDIFYGRIQLAFEYLEDQVSQGRIQAYGISSNTFPASTHTEDFVSLERVWHIAQDISQGHHFRVIQFPMNLYETGAALEQNQSNQHTILDYARDKQFGVLVNRPLNAFAGNRLVRLADVDNIGYFTDDEVIQAINLLNKSEKKLWRKLLPALNLPSPLYQRIKDQAGVGDQLKHHWRNFGNFERWRQFKDGLLWPHMLGVFEFLESYTGQVDGLDQWIVSHHKKLNTAVRAVGSLYVADAARQTTVIKRQVGDSDADWDIDGTLSQMALRALRSTSGISAVLVGMRRVGYVDDVLEEFSRPVNIKKRTHSWKRLSKTVSEQIKACR